MNKVIVSVSVGLILVAKVALAQGFYRWVDEKGTIHFTDDPTLIPERYRSQIQQKRPSKESESPAQPAAPTARPAKPVSPQEEADSASKKTDRLGRGEQWWRAKMKEWSDKLAAAEQGYEKAQTAIRGKAKELDEAKFKPDSLKRKLIAEKKSLEEKAKDWEKQVEEAKNMLGKVLPKEAQDFGADREWLKPKE